MYLRVKRPEHTHGAQNSADQHVHGNVWLLRTILNELHTCKDKFEYIIFDAFIIRCNIKSNLDREKRIKIINNYAILSFVFVCARLLGLDLTSKKPAVYIRN